MASMRSYSDWKSFPALLQYQTVGDTIPDGGKTRQTEGTKMGANRKYRWEQWFDRPITVLVRGTDYHCSQSTMVGMIRNNASRRGVRVRIVDTENLIIIKVANAVQHTDQVGITS